MRVMEYDQYGNAGSFTVRFDPAKEWCGARGCTREGIHTHHYHTNTQGNGLWECDGESCNDHQQIIGTGDFQIGVRLSRSAQLQRIRRALS